MTPPRKGQIGEKTDTSTAEKAGQTVQSEVQHDAQSSQQSNVTLTQSTLPCNILGDVISTSPKPVNAVNYTVTDGQAAPMAIAARDPYLVMLLEKFIDRVVGKSARKSKDNKTDKGLYCTFCHKNNHTSETCWAKADAEGRPRPNFKGSKTLTASPEKGHASSSGCV